MNNPTKIGLSSKTESRRTFESAGNDFCQGSTSAGCGGWRAIAVKASINKGTRAPVWMSWRKSERDLLNEVGPEP